MKKSKRIMSWVLVLCMVFVLSLVACGQKSENGSGENQAGDGKGSEQGKAEQITLKFLHRFPEEPFKGFLDDMVAAYEKDHPNVKIDIQAVANDPYKEKIKVVLGTDNAPDIFFSWSGEFLYRFVRENKIYDLTEAYNSDASWKDAMMEAQVYPFTYKDKLYGLPFRTVAKAFYYNKKMFKEYNVEVPKTWDEFIEVCETFKQKDITPIAYGNIAKWPSAHYIGMLFQKMVDHDVRLKDYNPESGEFTDQGYVEALKRYQQLIPYFNDNPNAMPHDMIRQNFANGKAAMAYLETIEIPYLENDAPQDFEYGMFSFPAIPEGKGNQLFVTGAPEGFVISANTKHPEEAVAFFRYITGPEVGKQQAKAIRWLNGCKGNIDESSPDKKLLDAYNMLVNAEGLAYWLDTDVHAKLVSDFGTLTQSLTSHEITPEEYMEKIRKTAQEVKKEFN